MLFVPLPTITFTGINNSFMNRKDKPLLKKNRFFSFYYKLTDMFVFLTFCAINNIPLNK